MAGKPEKPLTKEELLTEIALSRQALGADIPELASRCNPMGHLRRSIAEHPAGWFAGSAVAGLIAARLLLPRGGDENGGSSAARRAGARLLPVLAFILKTTRPAVEKILRERVSQIIENPGKETA